ncbi:DNA polymerase III delta prime subunit [Pararhizobium capsulatum DSM 1112]|uniref:DNA polymerase III delta prime subunit n=1 Tax=Pararhizobium capsulatum DSM 1112 TaxID=1121113 RepID=A0ABU0BN55_9HYPH|nr:hypothetical protein [Pararhizobium capsulatum]MDQ0319684.1 DNA polymerase III delta prime subunit [Pararhizobium capsulatum DSM 1112]
MNEKKSDNAQWLLTFLHSAVTDKLCTKISCTTCGARKFRVRLAAETQEAFARYDRKEIQRKALQFDRGGDSDIVFMLTESFAQVSPPKSDQLRMRDAAMLLLFDLDRIFLHGGDQFLLDEMLGKSWAGDVLAAMRARYEIDEQRRRDQALRANPKFVQAERERKKAERNKLHLARVARKEERLRKWLDSNAKKEALLPTSTLIDEKSEGSY